MTKGGGPNGPDMSAPVELLVGVEVSGKIELGANRCGILEPPELLA